MNNSNFFVALQALEQITKNPNKVVTKSDYEIFLKEFVFDKLQGKSFGYAFCNRFGFNDTFLKNLSDETAKYQIEALGYIK